MCLLIVFFLKHTYLYHFISVSSTFVFLCVSFSVYLSMSLCLCLSIFLCLSVCLSVCLSLPHAKTNQIRIHRHWRNCLHMATAQIETWPRSIKTSKGTTERQTDRQTNTQREREREKDTRYQNGKETSPEMVTFFFHHFKDEITIKHDSVRFPLKIKFDRDFILKSETKKKRSISGETNIQELG